MAPSYGNLSKQPRNKPSAKKRAAEYDEWYLGSGLFAERDRPGWNEDVRAVIEAVSSLSAARTVDVACGTGFLTQHLRGRVVGVVSHVPELQTRIPTQLRVHRGRSGSHTSLSLA